MRPIPVVFHIGFLTVHTYGVGLAITFLFAWYYFERRLAARGLPRSFVARSFPWIIAAAVIGARAVHVIANWNLYSSQPSQILQIWNGGLSSFGGLLGGLGVGIYLQRRRAPELGTWVTLDVLAPVLTAAWALGRLLGPQLMVSGGGRPTKAWYGMHYAGQVGKRVPVPIFQSIDDWIIFAVVVLLDHHWRKKGESPTGAVLSIATGLWGLSRFFEEKVWLAAPGQPGDVAVEVAGLGLFVAGVLGAAYIWRRQLRRVRRPGNAAPQPLSR